MRTPGLRITAAIALLCFAQLACFNRYTVTPEELEKLESGNIAESVVVESASGPVEVRAANPITVRTTDGAEHRVTPFNFIMSESQLVAPDYDLLLVRDNIESAEVLEPSVGKTVGLVAGGVVAAVGSFVLITVLAGSDSGL